MEGVQALGQPRDQLASFEWLEAEAARIDGTSRGRFDPLVARKPRNGAQRGLLNLLLGSRVYAAARPPSATIMDAAS